MARNRRDVFTTIRSEGALLPPDFLRQVAEDRRDCYCLYVVTHCNTEPRLQAIRDPAALPGHEVKKVDHYWLSVDVMGQPLKVREEPLPNDHGENPT